MTFDRLIEQAQARQLLTSALREGPAHAYLLHGPAGVGKRVAALAFAGDLLGDPERAERRAHPDLYVLEPHVMNLVIVLAITRTAIYLRVTRAEVLEIRERVFVDASRAEYAPV